MRKVLIAAVFVALVCAGGASAYALRTIMLAPGHCKRIGHTKVCARAAKTKTKTLTTTVAVSGIGKTFTGNGDSTLAPLTLTTGDEVHWTAQPDSGGDNSFVVSSDPNDARFVEFDNGSGTTSGSTFIPAGTYTFEVDANATWSLSF
jgi:plastocyanin